MGSNRMRFLVTFSCVVILAQFAAGQDDEQYGGWGRPKNQQVSALPQYESAEQPRQQQGFPQQPQQQYSPQGSGGSPQYGGTPQGSGGNPQNGGAPQGSGGAPQQQPNLWWQGQNAFQRPPGHPGVEQTAPSQPQQQQQQQQPNNYNPNYESYGSTTPKYNALGNGGPPGAPSQPAAASQPAFNPAPQAQTPQESFANPPLPPPLPPQDPNVEPQPSPIGQQSASPDSYNPPPPPPPPQQPPTVGTSGSAGSGGWSPPSGQPPRQNYNPQGGGFGHPPVNPAPGCDLVNKADCHNNNRRPNFNSPAPPSQNYQPPPQFQPEQPQPQPPYQPSSQQNNYQPVSPPNLGYEPPSAPPQQPQQSQQGPYQPGQPSRPNNQYQNNQQSSSSNYQPSRPQSPSQQQQKPYSPPQAPRPRPQQQYQQEQPQDPSAPYPGCPAAMKCVQDEYCNSIGLIEDAPIQFSAADRLHRVALMQCSEKMTGIVGVCCRDPNYVDPWPDMKNGGGGGGGHHHHHPDKGHSQGQPSFQPPQGNHLQSGNPYSGSRTNRNYDAANANVRNKKLPIRLPGTARPSLAAVSSPSNLLSESKQTLQVLEPCSPTELCLSMSQCQSYNPKFMAKTGLNPAVKHINNNHQQFNFNQKHQPNHTEPDEPVKIKRCKYERSGIHYLCCQKQDPPGPPSTTRPPTTAFPYTPPRFAPTTTTPPSTTITPRPFLHSTFSSSSPSIFTLPFTHHSASHFTPTTKSSLITGLGLRFHAGLHSAQQKQLNSHKPNPYQAGEEPIQLISPPVVEKSGIPTTTPFTFVGAAASHPFKFSTTTPRSFPGSGPFSQPTGFQNIKFQNPSPSTFSSGRAQDSVSAFSRIIGPTSSYFTTTTPSTSVGGLQTTPIRNSFPVPGQQNPFFNNFTTSTTTTTAAPPTSTEGKVDISRIPLSVPLRSDLKAEPPIGFIFKGEDLFIPDAQIPSQNYLVPINDFQERTFPTEEPQGEVDTARFTTTEESDTGGGELPASNEQPVSHTNSNHKPSIFHSSANPFLHNNSLEGTTIYSILE